MMPTTRAASTPSRRAMRKAGSKGSPVESDLQLQFQFTRPRAGRQADCCFNGGSRRMLAPSCDVPKVMKSLLARQTAALLLCLLLCGPMPLGAQTSSPGQSAGMVRVDPKRAQRAMERGIRAESDGRMDEALLAYDEAARYAPQDLALVGRGAALRSRLIREHVDHAERLAMDGKVAQAKEELNTAMRIDPTNQVVAERIAEMDSMQDDEPPPKATEISGMPRLKPQAGTRSFNLRGDTRSVYEQVAGAFGIKATFDPDLVSRNVHLQIDNVDFHTAVSILGSETGTFWRPIDAALMFVAPDTLEKRRQYGLQAEQTFALPSSVAPEEMTELLRVLREITGAMHIDLDAHSRTITMRDAPERLALAKELIRQVDRARGELMLEIELLEVDRNKAQQLGITPPSSTQAFLISPNDVRTLQNSKDLSNALTILGQLFSAKGLSSIPGFTLFGGGYTTFLLTLPGVAANFSDALSLIQSGRQVLLRAQNGKPATFFVGDRFPVTLSLLSGSLGTAAFTANPGGVSNPFPSTAYPAGVGPVALVAADFLNRGLIDLAAVNELDNSVSIFLNQSGNQGTFAEATGSPISLGPKLTTAPAIAPAIASAVLTSNGFHDLLITDPTTSTVLILFGNGDGTFKTPPTSIPVGKGPSAIVTSDFDGDGHQDFAVANFTDNTFSVFLGGVDTSGNPTFTPAAGSPFPLPTTVSGPIAMVAADFNRDGKPDLAIVNQTTLANPAISQGNVVVLEGNGDGTFQQFPGSPITAGMGNSPVAVASADLDGNTSADLAIVNQQDNSVTVLLNNGDATFAPGPNSPLSTSSAPTSVAIADFNQDGHADIAVTSIDANTSRVFLGVTAGFFTSAFEPPAGPLGTNPTAIVAAALVNGGFPDVAITNNVSGAAGDVTVILSPANLFSSSGLAQQPYPGSEYIDLGVKIKATPTLHPNNEVTLQ